LAALAMGQHKDQAMPRISLRSLFFGVAAVAMAITALRNANQWWAYLVATSVLVLLFYASLRVALWGRGETFWLGFAVVGWLWLTVGTFSFIGTPSSNGNLPIRPLFRFLHETLNPPPPRSQPGSYVQPPGYNARAEHLQGIMEFMCLGIIAGLGGVSTFVLSRRTVPPQQR
jgi:hypothetical protein